MNTYLTVSVKTSANNAIKLAYDAILAFDNVKDSYLEENIYTVYANIKYKRHNTLSLITVHEANDNSCIMTITANIIENIGVGFMQKTHEFAAEFLKRFSALLKQEC